MANTKKVSTTSKTTTTAKSARKSIQKQQSVVRSRERDNSEIEGYALIRLIKHTQQELGENSDNGLLQKLRLTRPYWNSFCNGTRPVSGLIRNKERREFLSKYLGRSQLELRVLAGDIDPEELVVGDGDALWLEMQRMRNDPRWGMLAPTDKNEWEVLPKKFQILIVSMYRMLTEDQLSETYTQTQEAPRKTVESL